MALTGGQWPLLKPNLFLQLLRDFFVLATAMITAVAVYPEWAGAPTHFGIFGVAIGLTIFSSLNLIILLIRPAWRLYYFCFNSAVQILPAVVFTTISLDYALMGAPMLLLNFAVLATLREKTVPIADPGSAMPTTSERPNITPVTQ